MQVYQVPYNFEHEEKIFGGYVSLRQAIYLILGVTSVGLFFLPIFNVTLKIIMFLMSAGICSVFAFLKTDGINADKYFIYIFRFLVKRKIYVLER